MKGAVFLFVACFCGTLLFGKDSTFFFKTSDNVRLYVRVAGQGRPAIFIHGGPGSTSHYYEGAASAPLVEKQLMMIYYDQRGSGRSDSAGNKDYSLSRMIRDIEELRASLRIKKWLVIGHSFAGILATNYVYTYPHAASGLVLVNATLDMNASFAHQIDFGIEELAIKDERPYRDPNIPLLTRTSAIHQLLIEKNIWYKLMFRNSFEKRYSDSVTAAIGKARRNFANSVWGLDEYWKDFSPLTSKILCPVLVITGDKDHAIGPAHYKKFKFPLVTLIHYVGGHAPFQEEPQWYAKKIVEFANE